MNIGVVTPGFSADEDDACIPALRDLVRALARDHRVTVFPLRYPHHRREYSVFGARVLPFSGATTRGLGRLPLFLRILSRLTREARHQDLDVLHAFWAHEPGYLATRAGRWIGLPVVVSLCGGEIADLPDIDYGGERRFANRWLTARALATAQRITVGSDFLGRLVSERVAAERLVKWPLGVDAERFSPGASGTGARLAGSPVLMHVASLVPVKDQQTLLAAFVTIVRTHPRAVLHLIGEGPLLPALERQARQLELDGQVLFHGAVRHELLPDFYRQADLVVQSSRFESQGMAILEAAACGCAVTGTGVGLLPEIAPTVPPGDPAALARLITAMLDARSPAEATALRASAYSLDKAVDALVEIYTEVCGVDCPRDRQPE